MLHMYKTRFPIAICRAVANDWLANGHYGHQSLKIADSTDNIPLALHQLAKGIFFQLMIEMGYKCHSLIIEVKQE